MKRHSLVRPATLTVSSPAAQISPPGQNRVTLSFQPPAAGYYSVWTEPMLTLGVGFVVSPETGPVELTIERHGDIVREPWYGIASTGLNMAVVETHEEVEQADVDGCAKQAFVRAGLPGIAHHDTMVVGVADRIWFS